jgi:DDE superfamily endonuclease
VEAAVASRPVDDQRPVLIMAQDEGRFGRICRPRACWAPPGIRPTAPCQLVREFVQVFAAVAPQTGELISLILPTANTAMMNLFLAHVSQTLADSFLVMQVDQAGWHHSRNLQVPDNIRLIAQPAHSPEVNPVEHLWEELREKYLHNRVFSSLDPLEEQLCQGLNAITDDKERVGSLMGFPHLKVLV